MVTFLYFIITPRGRVLEKENVCSSKTPFGAIEDYLEVYKIQYERDES